MSAGARPARPTRVLGMETEYGIAAVPTGSAAVEAAAADPAPGARPEAVPSPGVPTVEEAAALLFAPVRTPRKSTNRFLPNGSRLYLDTGAHPEYAGAECGDPLELLADDRAGEELLRDMVRAANAELERTDRPARIHLFKNNADSRGTPFGSHENYLVRRTAAGDERLEDLVTLLVTRQVLTGSGHVHRDAQGKPRWSFSQRADVIGATVSNATTRDRPMVNSRDEPHADAERYRRLHVIVGDSTIAQATVVLRFAMTSLVLDLLEAGADLGDLRLADPVGALRAVAHDMTARTPLELATGGTRTAIDLQEEILARVLAHVDATGGRDGLVPGVRAGLDVWERGVHAWRSDGLDAMAGELDWVAKHRLVERYRQRSGAALDDPRVERLLLAYHDVTADRPLARTLEDRGGLRVLVDPDTVRAARTTPPPTTRAHLRGAVVAEADRRDLDVFIGWAELRVDWIGVRPVELTDPFATRDPEVDAMIAALAARPATVEPPALIYG